MEDGEGEFSGIDSIAGSEVGVNFPLQLNKIVASMLILNSAERVLMQTSVSVFRRVRAKRSRRV